MTERLSLATSTGWSFLSVAFHVAVGGIALAAGLVAISVRKGGQWHRRSGRVFVVTMIATGLTAAAISAYEGKSVSGGAFTAYFVFTALSAVRTVPGLGRGWDIGLMMLAVIFSVGTYRDAFIALGKPGHYFNGAPAGMLFFLGTVMLLAAVGDLRMIRSGGIHGTRRIARHLWRMCFGLFIASGSFAAQLLKMVPPKYNSMLMVLVLGGGPIVLLLYWMWRIRLRQNLRGLLTSTAIREGPAT
jgi:uncharacterized membrane protein